MRLWASPLLFLLVAAPASAQSWLSGYRHRKPIEVQVSSSTGATPISVIVSTDVLVAAGELSATCDDVRFTLADGVTAAPFMLVDGCNTAATEFWVMPPSLAAPSTTLYLYFGNLGAPSASDPAQVTLFHDAFDTDPNTNGNWTSIYRQKGDLAREFAWTGESLMLLGLINTGGGGATFMQADASWEDAWVVRFRFRAGGGAGPNQGGDGLAFGFFHAGNAGIGNELGVAQTGYAIELDALAGAGDPSPAHVALVRTAQVTSGYTHLASHDTLEVKDGQWHAVQVQYRQGSVEVFFDGASVLSYSGTFDKQHPHFLFGAGTGADTNEHELDDVFLRRATPGGVMVVVGATETYEAPAVDGGDASDAGASADAGGSFDGGERSDVGEAPAAAGLQVGCGCRGASPIHLLPLALLCAVGLRRPR